jgi:hypothetical protein
MSAGRTSKRNNNSFVRINMPDGLVKTSNSTVGISTFDIKTTNQLPFGKIDLEKMLLGRLRVLLFFQRIRTRIHIARLKSPKSEYYK